MTWYRAYYGTWRKGDHVTFIEGTFNRKEMFDNAKKVANNTGRVVTVQAEHGTNLKLYKVDPEF